VSLQPVRSSLTDSERFSLISLFGHLPFLVGEDLARVHDPVGVDLQLYLQHKRQRVIMLFLEVLRLAGAYPRESRLNIMEVGARGRIS
jgi:hypothetical protein